ncbi:MAG: class I SAM-dependent methyltransferase [Myxococcota bacterium]
MTVSIQLADPGTANRRHFIQQVLPFLSLPGDRGIVDLGCGDGYYCGVLSEVSRALLGGQLPAYRGFDLDEDALARARAEYPHAEFHSGDITNGIAADSLASGLTLCCETFSILPDLEGLLERMLTHTEGTVAFDFLWSTDGSTEDHVLPLRVLPPFSYHLRSQRSTFEILVRVLGRHPEFHVRHTSSWAFSPTAMEEFTGVAGVQAANVWWVLGRD